MRLVLPIVVPLGAAATLLLTPARPLVQRWIAFTASILQLAAAVALFVHVDRAGYVVEQIGGGAAPFGITLVAHTVSWLLVVAVCVVGGGACVFFVAGLGYRGGGERVHPLNHEPLVGVR